jgi:hypothetical protein
MGTRAVPEWPACLDWLRIAASVVTALVLVLYT